MAAGKDPDRFRRRDLGSNLDEDHDNRGNGDRRSRLHQHAERAVIGVGSGVERMDMRYLDDHQKRKQCHTQHRGHLQTLESAADDAAEHCSESVQQQDLAVSIYQCGRSNSRTPPLSDDVRGSCVLPD
jgi:hypothetical protein